MAYYINSKIAGGHNASTGLAQGTLNKHLCSLPLGLLLPFFSILLWLYGQWEQTHDLFCSPTCCLQQCRFPQMLPLSCHNLAVHSLLQLTVLALKPPVSPASQAEPLPSSRAATECPPGQQPLLLSVAAR